MVYTLRNRQLLSEVQLFIFVVVERCALNQSSARWNTKCVAMKTAEVVI
jgi:hypothetical protein